MYQINKIDYCLKHFKLVKSGGEDKLLYTYKQFYNISPGIQQKYFLKILVITSIETFNLSKFLFIKKAIKYASLATWLQLFQILPVAFTNLAN